MIEIKNKETCVGCEACVQRCPRQCISMYEDEQGFLYPKVDESKCIDCNLCEQVCPVINQEESQSPLSAYAAKNSDAEIVRTSSSGGIFYALGEAVIKDGGVVFGARFDAEWQVVHDWTDTYDGLKAFQGSKYVQSRIRTTFQQVEAFLKAGRKVMFTGTPCQIKALVLFLRKDYGEQLLKVDVICHGVPSPSVWRNYLKYIARPLGASGGKNTVFSSLNDKPVITGISFRDKRLGWEKYGFSVRFSTTEESGKNSVFQSVDIRNKKEDFFEPLNQNIYMQGFLKDLYLRPSCYACPAKCGKSNSDITLGDFWGIKSIYPNYYSNEGMSLTIVQSTCGLDYISKIENIGLYKVNYSDAAKYNIALNKSPLKPTQSDEFWERFPVESISCINKIVTKMKPTIMQRIQRKLKLQRQ